jgi:hypothetical protein
MLQQMLKMDLPDLVSDEEDNFADIITPRLGQSNQGISGNSASVRISHDYQQVHGIRNRTNRPARPNRAACSDPPARRPNRRSILETPKIELSEEDLA